MASVSKFLTFMLILMMVALISLARLQDGETVDFGGSIARGARKDLVGKKVNKLPGLVMEDSAREVPTGPDPLHHHGSPPSP
ncbi:unnamed protein product [Linum trigynum]|uniref:Uncharacterized protein n=1 Tax=Linum trigynum TaxID=586398 RepID=A0AAV2EZF2_9ROSI